MPDEIRARLTHIEEIAEDRPGEALEDFDGGHVWELGYLYHHQTHLRDVLWLLKRIYDNEEETGERYDSGMAASHLAALEEAAGDRVITWSDVDELSDAVERIP